jgi:hypothetical protein
MRSRYRIYNEDCAHFITSTIVEWLTIFKGHLVRPAESKLAASTLPDENGPPSPRLRRDSLHFASGGE